MPGNDYPAPKVLQKGVFWAEAHKTCGENLIPELKHGAIELA
jgi:hypothetical protein